MRSGNGKHRRPRQAPALLVAAGVTGAGIAIPLLGAGGAQAADGTTWDKVAQCESGGLWSANKGNDHFGGLQLTQKVWEEYGGTAYAERPDLASRSQQIAIAEKILDAEGTAAFPDCADVAGLTAGSGSDSASGHGPAGYPAPGGSADEDDSDDSGGTADEPTPAPSESSGSSDPSSPSDSEGSSGSGDSADPSGPASPSGKPSSGKGDSGSGDKGDSGDKGGSGSGKHRGKPAEGDEGRGDGQDERGERGDGPGAGDHERGGHPSRGDGAREGAGKHRVKAGDSLSQIASDEKIRGGWTALYERNRDIVGEDPDLIHPGQKLTY